MVPTDKFVSRDFFFINFKNNFLDLFDLRKGIKAVEQSLIEYSHRECVRNALWLQSKTGTECFSASTDGQIYWWDTRKLNEPIEKFIFDLEKKERSKYAIGITKLQYDSSIVRNKIIFYFIFRELFLFSQQNLWLELKMVELFYVLVKIQIELMLFIQVIMEQFIQFNDIHFLIKYFYQSVIGLYGFGRKKYVMIISFRQSLLVNFLKKNFFFFKCLDQGNII